jgi:hypothetical protein
MGFNRRKNALRRYQSSRTELSISRFSFYQPRSILIFSKINGGVRHKKSKPTAFQEAAQV